MARIAGHDSSWTILVLCVTAAVFQGCMATTAKPGSPVVFVPGDGGNQLLAKLNKPTTVSYWCSRVTNEYYTLWLSLSQLTPLYLSCFADNMRMIYDPDTHTSRNSPGVDIKVPEFGRTSSMEYLTSIKLSRTAYYAKIIDAMVEWGYTRNANIRGAPYDFRKAPNEASVYLRNLTLLIEETYKENNNKKVVLIAHSMGNLYTQYLLYQKPQAWKDKFIKSWVAIAAPWGGVVKIMKLFASGETLGIPFVNPLTLRAEQRTSVANIWLMPYDTFWGPQEVLISRPGRNYTVKDFEQFFKDLNFPQGWLMRQDTEPLIKDFQPPNVEVHCLNGKGVPTPTSFRYEEGQWPDSPPSVINGEGDGTVNERSLVGCTKWTNKQDQAVHHKRYMNADHMAILKHQDVISYIRNVLYQ